MSDKKRERECNREKYEKKQRKKKTKNQKKQAQAISRKKRNEVRKGVKSNFYDFRTYKARHIFLVIQETENTETVLLQKYKMSSNEKGILLALPVITEEMIDEYLNNFSSAKSETTSLVENNKNTALRDFVRYYFAVEPGEIIETTNIIFIKDCKKLGNKENLIEATVQPYKIGKKWFEGEKTTIHGYKIYNGHKIRSFIKTSLQDLDNVYMFQDTLTEFALYKSIRKKINFTEYYSYFCTYARNGSADLFGRGISFNPDTYEPVNNSTEIVNLENVLQNPKEEER